MKKVIIWILGIIVFLVGGGIIGLQYLKNQTKSLSPEREIHFAVDNLAIDVFYCRPSARGRKVFGQGALVPYDQVWRTGANEATTFSTQSDIYLMGELLPAGEYTLWTIPDTTQWNVIFNNKQYAWGVNYEGLPSREIAFDVLNLEIPAEKSPHYIEMFTIDVDAEGLSLAWENTHIEVPFGSEPIL